MKNWSRMPTFERRGRGWPALGLQIRINGRQLRTSQSHPGRDMTRERPLSQTDPETLTMNRSRQPRLITATLLLALMTSPAAWAQSGNSRVFGDLLKRIPEQSNALI